MSVQTDTKLTVNPNTIINGFMEDYATFLEVQIKSKNSMIELLRKELETNPDNIMAQSQIRLAISDMKDLIKSLLELRKDSDFLASDTKTIISAEGFCPDCGESKKLETFEINDTLSEADFDSFNNSSSFVGTVTYDRDTSNMSIILNGKTYDFCNVPARKFEGMKGASSQGAYFNREIKEQYNC
jgi:hypothetical protein